MTSEVWDNISKSYQQVKEREMRNEIDLTKVVGFSLFCLIEDSSGLVRRRMKKCVQDNNGGTELLFIEIYFLYK